MITLLLIVYVLSALIAGVMFARELRRDGVIYTGELVASLFLTFCPVVNTGILGLAIAGGIEYWLEKRGLSRRLFRVR